MTQDTIKDTPGLEKMMYGTFVRNFTCYRRAQIPMLLVKMTEKIQLPDGSMLHLLDNMSETNTFSDTPNVLQNQLIINEIYRRYIYHNITLVGPDDLFYKKFSHIFRIAGFTKVANDFKTKHRAFIYYARELDTVYQKSTVLTVINHNPLWRARVMGRMADYNKFELILRSILQFAIGAPAEKHQYIQIPLSTRIYPKQEFTRPATKGISTATITITDDDSYYFLVHFFSWMLKNSEISLFDLIPSDMLPYINLMFMVRDRTIIYNLEDVKNTAINDNTVLMYMRHINLLKLSGLVSDENKLLEISEMTGDRFDQVVSEEAQKQAVVETTEMLSDEDEVGIVDEKKVVVKKAPVPTIPPPTIQEERAEITAETIEKVPDITPAQKRRLTVIADKHGKVMIGDRTVQEILSDPVDTSTTTEEISCLIDTIPDRSMLKSTVIDMDTLYIKHLAKKDMVQVITSFSKNGMFMVDYAEEPHVDELNRYTLHKVSYEDTHGKKHLVKYKLPIVDADGTFLINGIASRMKKQQVNLPICKISSTRVSLAASYKTLVEKNVSKAHTFDDFVHSYIDKTNSEKEIVTISYGNNEYSRRLPYEYTCLGRRYNLLKFGKYTLNFVFADRVELFDAERLYSKYEKKHGVLFGSVSGSPNIRLYIGMDNRVRFVDVVLGDVDHITTIYELLAEVSPVAPTMVSEWTDLKILDQKLPIMFILCYRFGLTKTLRHLGAKYTLVDKGIKIDKDVTDLVIKFSDKSLVFNRYPVALSLIVAGLMRFDTTKYSFEEFEGPDVYYELLTDKNISTNYMKGIDAFFTLFLDPLTRDVLEQMGEPTNIRDLLIRASTMLATEEFIDPASMANHRIRSYERFNAILYDEMARQLATHQNQKGKGKAYSINPEAVFQRILQDQAVMSVNEINPVHDVKEKSGFTYTGVGGRSATSFVIGDRQYPDDGVGVMSEATPDSGKVAISAYTSMNPKITNLRGMYDIPTKHMTFPDTEHVAIKARLKLDGNVSTTRTSSEQGKYKVGDVVTTDVGIHLKVTRVDTITDIKKHPYYDDLTAKQKKEIGTEPFDVIWLATGAIEPTELLSVAALLMPGVTNDDQQIVIN